MTKNLADPVNSAAVSLDIAAKLLSRVGGVAVTEESLRQDVESGAPLNADGTMNLLHYGAWLVSQKPRTKDGR